MRSKLHRWSPAVLRWALAPQPETRAGVPHGCLPAAPEGGRASPESIPGLEAMEALDADLYLSGYDGYPRSLEDLFDQPPFLWTRGTPWGEGPRVGIVGSRAASRAGREIAYGLARDLALAGLEIWSGLARGIDGAAHRGALAAQGRTGAVLGTGLDECYPSEHRDLLDALVLSGGVVTEFPPGSPPRRFHFPRRNRVLAALVQVLVVVEGGERSGARSTVDHALDLGREVMAVPRDPVHPGSALPNALLREGAAPVITSRDVLAALPPGLSWGDALDSVDRLRTLAAPAKAVEEAESALSPGARIRQALETSSATVEELAERTRLDLGTLQAMLLELELDGEIEKIDGRVQRRSQGDPTLRRRR